MALDVGLDVCAAETVNGLFGVADHDQSMILTISEDTFKDLELDDVRVLEFIDHGDFELFANEVDELLETLGSEFTA